MPYKGKRIAVVVPAHNEERFVGGVISSIPAFVDSIVVVDDGSTDETLARAGDSPDSRVSIIALPSRRGVGAAITAGYERSLSLGSDISAVMAGDGQMDPRDLPALLDPLVEGRADYSKGNRFLDPEIRKKMPLIRQVGNVLLSVLTRCITGLPVWDSQCGYTAVTAQMLGRLLGMPACRGYGYPNKILANLSILRARVVDIPVRCIYGQEISNIIIPLYFLRLSFILACCLLRRFFGPFIRGPSRKRSPGLTRICLLTSSYPRFDGDIAGNFIRELCIELSAGGLSFDIVAPDAAGAVPLRDEGIAVHRFTYFLPRRLQRLCYGDGIESNLSGNPLLYFQAPLLFLSFLVSAWRFSRRSDLIWSHWLIPAGLAGAVISMITGKPHVATIHSGGVFSLKRMPLGGAVARFIGRHSSAVTAVGSFSLRQFEELAGGSRAAVKSVVIPMGVRAAAAVGPAERAGLREKYGFNGSCVILYMGRLIKLKGLHNLLRAAGRVEHARLVIAGEGPEKASLKRLAEELEIDAEFHGFLSGRRKREFLAASDALVYPSLAEPSGRTEGIPVAILESLASGRPVVASAVGGIPEIIRDDYNGYLVPSGDVRSLAEKLREIAVDGDRLERLSRAAYESGREYGLERIAPAFEMIFKGCGRVSRPDYS
ncbi:MAG: glycosyltransferase [Candidatus Tritonobacter lacicola]|nr:glycosyltransferase [Candidatus Tritonobacter lacicola]